MVILGKAAVYYVAGSVIAGVVMGTGFTTNLGGRVTDAHLKALERIGTYIPLNVEPVDGGLIAVPDARRPTIVYVHGRSANRMELMPLAEALFHAGYNAVLWDSKSRHISYGPREIEQILQVVRFVRNDPHVDAGSVFVIGFSLGGAMAIGAAAADVDHHISGVIADSSYADLKSVATRYLTAFGIIPNAAAWPARTITFGVAKTVHGIAFEDRNPVEWAHRVSCPVLLIHGKADWRIPPQHSKDIFGQLNSTKELWLVDNAGHTGAFQKNPAEYVQHVVRFLSSLPHGTPSAPRS